MVLRDIQMTGRCLPQRAHAKIQAIALPFFLIHLKYRYAGGRARQAGLSWLQSIANVGLEPLDCEATRR